MLLTLVVWGREQHFPFIGAFLLKICCWCWAFNCIIGEGNAYPQKLMSLLVMVCCRWSLWCEVLSFMFNFNYSLHTHQVLSLQFYIAPWWPAKANNKPRVNRRYERAPSVITFDPLPCLVIKLNFWLQA